MVDQFKNNWIVDGDEAMHWVVDNFSVGKRHNLLVFTKVRNVNNSALIFKKAVQLKTIFVGLLTTLKINAYYEIDAIYLRQIGRYFRGI